MESLLKTWATNRQLCLSFFDHHSLHQLNTIPKGFSNNLIWNLGHIIVAQQSLVYKGANLPMYISDNLLNRYKPGTQPTTTTTQTEVDELRRLLLDLVVQTKADIAKGLLTTASYNERTTVTGFHLSSIYDALHFNNYHEGLHVGIMMSIRKFV